MVRVKCFTLIVFLQILHTYFNCNHYSKFICDVASTYICKPMKYHIKSAYPFLSKCGNLKKTEKTSGEVVFRMRTLNGRPIDPISII